MANDTVSRITVKLATPKDLHHAETIHRVINAAFRSNESWITDSALVAVDRITLEGTVALIEKSSRSDPFLLAFDGSQVVGAVLITPNGTEALVGMLSVSPTHQSRGVGALLMRESVKFIEQEMPHIKEALVHVFQSRTELTQWYVRLGFQDNDEVIPFPYKEILLVDEAPLVILRRPITGHVV